MIDVAREQLLTLREAAKRIPGRGGRRSLHVSALYRWAQRGVRGVVLETIPVGGTLYTSVEAVQRFCEELGRQRRPGPIQSSSRRADAARRELERHGF